MKAYTYINKGRFELVDKPNPTIQEPTDAIVRVTMSSICTSDLHIKHGCFPLAKIAEAYELFEQKLDGAIKVAITQ